MKVSVITVTRQPPVEDAYRYEAGTNVMCAADAIAAVASTLRRLVSRRKAGERIDGVQVWVRYHSAGEPDTLSQSAE